MLPYGQAIYSFADEWGWTLALTDPNLTTAFTQEEIDNLIKDRIQGELRFLDGIGFQRIFLLPKNIRKTLAEEKRIITSEKPAIHYTSFTSNSK